MLQIGPLSHNLLQLAGCRIEIHIIHTMHTTKYSSLSKTSMAHCQIGNLTRESQGFHPWKSEVSPAASSLQGRALVKEKPHLIVIKLAASASWLTAWISICCVITINVQRRVRVNNKRKQMAPNRRWIKQMGTKGSCVTTHCDHSRGVFYRKMRFTQYIEQK